MTAACLAGGQESGRGLYARGQQEASDKLGWADKPGNGPLPPQSARSASALLLNSAARASSPSPA